jgi:hypothetical protein
MAAVFLGVAAAAAGQGLDENWSATPAASARPPEVALSVPTAPDEDSIRLVGATVPPDREPLRPPRVFAVALPAAPKQSDPAPALAAIPARARWPDASGRIVEDLPGALATGTDAVRNPWIPRLRPAGPQRAGPFAFGGYIAGGDAGPVGIINGRSARRGDAIGDFVIERIVPAGVVLERAGALYVIPPGNRVTIALRNP